MRHIHSLAGLLALGASLMMVAGQASAGVSFSVGISAPLGGGARIGTVISSGHPGHYGRPAPIYQAAPVVYAPAPVVYGPPVYMPPPVYAPAPVVYAPAPVYRPYRVAPRPRAYYPPVVVRPYPRHGGSPGYHGHRPDRPVYGPVASYQGGGREAGRDPR